MKKIIFLVMAAILSTMMYAQDRKMSELKISQLPVTVTDFIAKNLPGSTITRAGKIEEKGAVNYVAVIERKGIKHSYLFDKEGKLIGKGDHLLEKNAQTKGTKPVSATPATDNKATAPAAKPPVKTLNAKPATKAPATETAAPKK